MLRPLLLATVLCVTLAACDGADNGKDGTSIAINTGDNGTMVAGMDGNTGEVSLNFPGFKAKLNLPKIQLDAKDFDMNGVNLYPGSKITGMNIEAHDNNDDDRRDDDRVRISFDSPADPQTVHDWFAERLPKADFKVESSGTSLSGKTDDDQPFKLDLTADGDGKSKGTIVMGG